MTALSDGALPLLIGFSDPLQIPSLPTISLVSIGWGHLKDDPPQENNVKGLGNLRIQRRGVGKRIYLTSMNAIHFVFKSSLRDDLSQYLDMWHLFVHAILWGGVGGG